MRWGVMNRKYENPLTTVLHNRIQKLNASQALKQHSETKWITYLNYLVLLTLVDFSGEAAARQRVVNDEFVGLETGFFEELRSCEHKHRCLPVFLPVEVSAGRTTSVVNYRCDMDTSSLYMWGKKWKQMYLCILGQAKCHWNQSPILCLQPDLPVYLVSHTLQVNLVYWEDFKQVGSQSSRSWWS